MAERLLSATQLEVHRDGRRVLGPLDLEARAGQRLGVLGPNGAGKSTLLEALIGLLPHGGRVKRNGELAWVPQRSELRSDLSVRSVVAQGRYRLRRDARLDDRDQTVIRWALGEAGAAELADRRFLRLSEGEKRRVLIARALASEASVLLLDEPTAGLDLGHALDLGALIERLARQNQAVIVVLHDLGLAARFMDELVVLQDGEIVARGPAEEALRPEVLNQVWGLRALPKQAPLFERSHPS
ncbi:MAG: ABC transporter ATP-binding protein [Myxococcota bacterium]